LKKFLLLKAMEDMKLHEVATESEEAHSSVDHNVVEAADKATEAHAVEGHNEVTEAVEPITLL
jgi:hypothetical protein